MNELYWALLPWFIVAVAFGFAGAGLGRVYRDNEGLGFLLGAIFGPIGLVMIAGIKDRRPTCPECGGVIVPRASRCKNCAARLGWRSPSQVVAQEANKKDDDYDVDQVMEWVQSQRTK